MINLNTPTIHKVLEILQKHDGYNTYVIIENNVPSWLCGLKKHTGHRYL